MNRGTNMKKESSWATLSLSTHIKKVSRKDGKEKPTSTRKISSELLKKALNGRNGRTLSKMDENRSTSNDTFDSSTDSKLSKDSNSLIRERSWGSISVDSFSK